MSFNVTEAMLKDAFSPFGNIVDLKVLMHEGSNKPKGCGFIVYDNPLSVLKAFQHAIVIDAGSAGVESRLGPTSADEVRRGTGQRAALPQGRGTKGAGGEGPQGRAQDPRERLPTDMDE